MASAVALTPTETTRRTIDLLIAADSPMDCQLLKNALAHSRLPFRVVASALSQREVVSSANAHSLDVALISETLQDGPLSGFGVLSEMRNSFPSTKVVLLLKSNREDLIIDAFRAGVRGVLLHAEPLQTLCKCIHVVQGGQIWANTSQLRCVLDAFAQTAPLRLVNSQGRALLTKREEDVVTLVVDGNTNREVAGSLGLTEHTVSNYLFRVYEKLGISTRVELILYSLKGRRHAA